MDSIIIINLGVALLIAIFLLVVANFVFTGYNMILGKTKLKEKIKEAKKKRIEREQKEKEEEEERKRKKKKKEEEFTSNTYF